MNQRPTATDAERLPYDRRLARRLANDLLAARQELATCRAATDLAAVEHCEALDACRAAAAVAADRHARELAHERAQCEERISQVKATETWRVGAAVVALPRWIQQRLRELSK